MLGWEWDRVGGYTPPFFFLLLFFCVFFLLFSLLSAVIGQKHQERGVTFFDKFVRKRTLTT